MKQDRYEVIVGNIGSVHSGRDLKKALRVFNEYAEQSQGNYGRAAGEDVTLMRDGEPYKEYYGHQVNPSGIKAQVRRLPSGQIQLKVPLRRGENPLTKAHQLAKALGRKVVSVTRAGGRVLNPQLQKYTGGYYRVGDFYIGKAPSPMPKGQAWSIYTREGQVVGRAGSLQAAATKAQQYIDRGIAIENPTRRYPTSKKPGDPTYSSQWSGVTGAPVARGLSCPKCGGKVHKEGDSLYCPYCDDYVRAVKRNPSKAYWQYPWVVITKPFEALSAGFSTEKQARSYTRKLNARSVYWELLHNTGTNDPGGVKSISSKSY